MKALELPFPHDVSDAGEPETWVLTVRGDGKVTARFADGEVQGIDVREGDFILASAQAIYVSRSMADTDHRGNVRREPVAEEPPPAKRASTSARKRQPRKQS